MTDRPRLLVDIVADPVCPWCYVGLRSFVAARETLAASFEIVPRFRAYQLNPDIPAGGVDRAAHYERKFPDKDQRSALLQGLIAAAREAGFDFDPMLPTVLPNTLMAQQVIRQSHLTGAQMAFAGVLYAAYWDRGADIGDRDVLVELAGAAGMDEAEIRGKLESGAEREAAAGEAAAFRRAGVSGVPTFIVNERTGFSGALPHARLVEALKQAAA